MVSKARIRLSSTDPQDINTICAEIKEIADKTGVKLKGPIPLPTKKLMVPTRKSPAGQGTNTFDKWEMRIHKRLIDVDPNERFLKRTGSVAETQLVVKSVPVFGSHRKRTVLILALLALGVIGVSVAAASYDRGVHWHPHLSLTLNGSPYTVPANIGIDPSLWKDHSLDEYGSGAAALHTHDTSGTIHVEVNTSHRDFTLHEFLAIWGQPSDGSAIDGHLVTSVTVDGVQQASPTWDVILKDGQKIAMTLSA